MTNPTIPLHVQEPAGAVEAHRLADELKSLRRRRSGIVCGLLTAAECDKLDSEQDALIDRLAALASLQPVTQAKSEAVALLPCPNSFVCAGRCDNRCEEGFAPAAIEKQTHFCQAWGSCDYCAICGKAMPVPTGPVAAPQEAVERQPLTGWISVDERLPEENVPVLVTKDGGHEYIDLDVMEEGVWRDWCEYVEHVEVIGGRTSDVKLYTHWAPIPRGIGPATQERPHA